MIHYSRIFLAMLVFAVLAPQSARPTPARTLSIQEMESKAELIVKGKVKSKTCLRSDQGYIFTRVAIEVSETWKGSLKREEVTIVQFGGTLGDERVVVPGQATFQPGERMVAFLVRNDAGDCVVLGTFQGKFELWQSQENGSVYARNGLLGGIPQSGHSPAHRHGAETSHHKHPHPDAQTGSLKLEDLKRRVVESQNEK